MQNGLVVKWLIRRNMALTKKQKKLPIALQKAIMKKQKKSNNALSLWTWKREEKKEQV